MKTAGEVAKIFNVDRNIVKKWAYLFKEYLNDDANPPKGQIRKFSDKDIPILAYIFEHWEMYPDSDIEDIKFDLNNEEHEKESYYERLYESSQIFQEPPDDLGETWTHGFLLNGANIGNPLSIARYYKDAVDTLIEKALGIHESYEFAYSIIYLCRHTIELYLKIIGDSKEKTHNLEICMKEIEKKYDQKISGTIRNWICEFQYIDKKGTTFRYADDNDSLKYSEYWIDLHQLNYAMDKICFVFEHVIINR